MTRSIKELRDLKVDSMKLGELADTITELKHKQAFGITENGKTFKYDAVHNKVNEKKPTESYVRKTKSGKRSEP